MSIQNNDLLGIEHSKTIHPSLTQPDASLFFAVYESKSSESIRL